MKTSNPLPAASLALVLATGALSARTTPPVSDLGRQDLMGPWQVAAVPGDPKQADLPSLDAATWAGINAPFLLTRLPGLDAKTAETVHYAWARREFVAPAETAYRNAVLHLHGVRWGSKIWLNGREVGSHLGAYGAFEFDLADALQWGRTNTLLLRLTGWPEIPRSKTADPTHVGAFPLVPHGAACFVWGNRQAGIGGAVWIDYFDHARLQDVQILTDISSGQVVVRGGMRNFTRQFGQRWIEPTVIAPDGAVRRGARVEVPWPNTALRREVFEFTTEMKIRGPQRWSPDRPALYRLHLDLVQEGAILHRWSENFGFRSFEARSAVPPASGGFYLNNERVFLRGICTVGMPHLFAAPAERPGLLRRMLVEAPKAANLNCIRNHTVPLDGEALDVMDRHGIMLLQDRSLPPLGLEIPRVDGLGGASTVFRAGPADFIAWRVLGADSRLLRRFNGPTGAVVRLPLAPRPGDDPLAVAAQEGQMLNWTALARRAVGRGELILCQLVLADHLAGDHADPVAQTILVNLLADGK